MKRYALVSRLSALGTLVLGLLIGFLIPVEGAKVAHSLPEHTNFNISLKQNGADFNLQADAPRRVQKVVLDAGHGGKDSGCTGKNSLEKDIALDITLRVGQMIKNNFEDVEVVYTRDRDVFVPLHERAQIANKSAADLFVSIHCNTTAKRNSASGTETFVMGLHRAEDNLAVAKRENAAIIHEQDYLENYGGYDPNSDEGHITLSMYQNAYLDQSIALANFIEEEFQDHGQRVSRGVKQAGFLVLRNTVMPSVLIETGFLNHNKEETFLKSEAGKNRIASSIFNAFSKYKYDVDQMVASHEPESSKAEAIPASYTEETNATPDRSIESDVSITASNEKPAKRIVEESNSKETSINYVERAKMEMAKLKAQRAQNQAGNTSVIPKPSKPAESKPKNSEGPSKADMAKTSQKTQKPTKEQPATDRTVSSSPQKITPREKKLAYVVQLSASAKKLTSARGKWASVQNEVMIRFENNLYKYQVGELASYDEALAKKDKLKKLGFNDCFIVAYYDDDQINIKDAMQIGK